MQSPARPKPGAMVLKGLRFKGENDWGDGIIYEPQHGGQYSLFISMNGKNTLHLRGYLGISIFGRTEIWTRAKYKKAR